MRHRLCRGPLDIGKRVHEGRFQPSAVLFCIDSGLEDLCC